MPMKNSRCMHTTWQRQWNGWQFQGHRIPLEIIQRTISKFSGERWRRSLQPLLGSWTGARIIRPKPTPKNPLVVVNGRNCLGSTIRRFTQPFLPIGRRSRTLYFSGDAICLEDSHHISCRFHRRKSSKQRGIPVWVQPLQPRGWHSTELSYLAPPCPCVLLWDPWRNIHRGQGEEDRSSCSRESTIGLPESDCPDLSANTVGGWDRGFPTNELHQHSMLRLCRGGSKVVYFKSARVPVLGSIDMMIPLGILLKSSSIWNISNALSSFFYGIHLNQTLLEYDTRNSPSITM